MPIRLIAATRSGIAVAEEAEAWRIETALGGEDVRSLVVASPARHLYAGTQGNGVFRSDDSGATWSRAGLAGEIVKALAVGPDGAVYAGTKPPALFVSRNAGESWLELEGFRAMRRWYWRQPAERPHTPYVQALAVSPVRADTILAGIEAFRVLRSDDGGESWIRLRRGVSIDCHDLAFHPADGDRAYEGAGLGASTSSDAGRRWTRAAAGLDRRYVMSLAVDPADPDLWYVGAAPVLKAHSAHSNACLFRWAGNRFEKLAGGLPPELEHLPTTLVSPKPGIVYAGLRDGTVWRSHDRGDTWARLPLSLNGVRRLAVVS